MRAISSITSSTPSGSGRTSGRLVGISSSSTPSPPGSRTVKPSGPISSVMRSPLSSTPIWLCTRATGTRTTKGSGTWPRTSSRPSATSRSGTLSPSSWQKRATEVSIPQGSQPRSKRADASVRRPSRLEVRAMAIGVK